MDGFFHELEVACLARRSRPLDMHDFRCSDELIFVCRQVDTASVSFLRSLSKATGF
jgi:hypothetical protein